jgi:uncharacterized membrane protein
MNGLIAVGYPNVVNANAALGELMELQKEQMIQLEDAVVVEMRGDGKVKLHQTTSTAAVGAAGGALWGGLIGLLFFAPLLGMAVGAAAGGAAGAASDVGVDNAFLKQLGAKLEPGHAALVLLVQSATMDKVLDRLHGQYQGELVQSSLSSEEEEQLKIAAEHARMAAEKR